MNARALRPKLPGLKLSALEWGEPGAPYVLLVHGYMDAAATWDLVAPELARRGHHVVALDLRGYGDSAWVGPQGYYHFADYVLDVAEFLDATGAPSSITLVGHSMGGVVTTLFAGARPERVRSLVLVEGLGPPDSAPRSSVPRMGDFLRTVQENRTFSDTPMTLEQAFVRLKRNHSTVDEAIVRTRLPHLVRRVEGTDTYLWKRDPLHRTRNATPFYADTFGEFVRAVTADVLWIDAGNSGYHPPDGDARLEGFSKLRKRIRLDGATHMLHWTRPRELALAIAEHAAHAVV